jgi:hypothetical protein
MGPFALVLSILSSVVVGTILVAAPWTPLWDGNVLLQPFPALRAAVLSPYARGAVSGLGLVNLVLAAHELRELLATRSHPGA